MKGFMLDLLAWNCEVDNPDHMVAETLNTWVELYQPDVFALSEASTHHDVLAEVAPLLGYQLLQERPDPHRSRGDDTGDSALLLADHVELRRHHVAGMRKRWRVLSHDVVHDPHRYEVVTALVRGQRWRLAAPHFPTHGPNGANADAWEESARWARGWLRRGALTPSVAAGDLNASKAELRAWFGPRIGVAGHGPDNVLTRRVAHVSTRDLGRGGSDHHGILYTAVAAI